MSKYEVLILDLDGTTIPSVRNGMPSERVKVAVRAANKFVKVCVATGRPLDLATEILKVLEINGPCVLDGGAEIIDIGNNKIVFKKHLSLETQRQIVKICQRFAIICYASESKTSTIPLAKPSDVTVETGKLYIDGISKEIALSLVEELESVDSIACHLSSSWSRGNVVDVHITDVEATKKHGVEQLLQMFGVKKNQVIGVGDNHNDLPMLEAVGFKVAMGNSPPEVKAAADYVTASVDNDGVVEVIEKFIL